MNIHVVNRSRPGYRPEENDIIVYEYPEGYFVEKTFYPYPEMPIEDHKIIERSWRNEELKNTDWIVPITDHPKHSLFLTYRQQLREYPEQEDFPTGTRPVRPE